VDAKIMYDKGHNKNTVKEKGKLNYFFALLVLKYFLKIKENDACITIYQHIPFNVFYVLKINFSVD
jgi:hypothetical protein